MAHRAPVRRLARPVPRPGSYTSGGEEGGGARRPRGRPYPARRAHGASPTAGRRGGPPARWAVL